MQNGKSLGKNFRAVLLSANVKTSAETLGKVMLQTVANFHAITCMSIQIPPRLHLGHVPKGRTFKFISCKMNRKTEEENQCRCLKSNLRYFFFPSHSRQIQNLSKYIALGKQHKSSLIYLYIPSFRGWGYLKTSLPEKGKYQRWQTHNIVKQKTVSTAFMSLFVQLKTSCDKIKHALKTNFSLLKWTTQK